MKEQRHDLTEDMHQAKQIFSPFNWLHGEIKDTSPEIMGLCREIGFVDSSLGQEMKLEIGSLRQAINTLRLWILATLPAVAISTIGLALFLG